MRYKVPVKIIKNIGDAYEQLTNEWRRILGGTDLQIFLDSVKERLLYTFAQKLEIDDRELILLYLASSELGLGDIFQLGGITGNYNIAIDYEEIHEKSERLKMFYKCSVIAKLVDTGSVQAMSNLAPGAVDGYCADVLREEREFMYERYLARLARPKHKAYLLQRIRAIVLSSGIGSIACRSVVRYGNY